jgi:alkaline phosphatase D
MSEQGFDWSGGDQDGAAWQQAVTEWWSPSSEPIVLRPTFTGYPFTLGVASGSPGPTSVVLWTRLAPDPLHGGGMDEVTVPVRWEVADDEAFRRVARRGTATALPGRGHAVHVEVTGLRANRWYWYRFLVGDDESPHGRTRTAPAATAAVRRLRFGFGSCQQYEQGYYAAHRHLADEDLDVMIFLGDYIYESSWGRDFVRRHSAGEPRTLDEYRDRHAQYKTDPDLQTVHRNVPWLVTWDDHEVDNDYADNRSEDLDPQFLTRRAAGYQAFFEHMPLRAVARPKGPDMALYAHYDWGRLARIHLLDARQYRSWQVCPRPGRGGANIVDSSCDELFDPDRTMLGRQQESWLEAGLVETKDRWNIIGSSVLMARADPKKGNVSQYWTDAWDGYGPARQRLLQRVADAAINSCVVISGDAHSAYAADLKVDFTEGAPIVASEFCATSITSQGRSAAETQTLLDENAHLHYADSSKRGYGVIDLTPARATMRFRVLGNEKVRSTGVSTERTFFVRAGQPGVHEAS